MKRSPDGRGFTLTELLVVVAVIMILLSLLIVSVDGIYTYAMQLKCQHRMGQIWHGCLMYASANQGSLPAAWNVGEGCAWYETLLAGRYVDNRDALGCPSSDVAMTASSGAAALSVEVKTVTQAITDTLDWLKTEQRSDGSWACPGWSGQHYGMTGLALLCFLGYGATDTEPDEYKDVVADAIDFLIATQRSDGSWVDNFQAYDQGICTMALAEAFMMTGHDHVRVAAQEALNFLLTLPSGYGGFPEHPLKRYNDMSSSAWCYQAIAAAVAAGLDVPESALTMADDYFRTVICAGRYHCDWGHRSDSEELVDGRCWCGWSVTKYLDEYWTPYEFNPTGGPHAPGISDDRMTAASLYCRILFGHQPTSDHDPRTYSNGENAYNQLEWLTRPIDLGAETVPFHIIKATEEEVYNYDAGGGWIIGYDIYFIYYCTLALYKAGGAEWDQWAEAFAEPLIAKQDDDGGFPLEIAMFGGTSGTRAYPSTLACLALEAAVGSYLNNPKWRYGPTALSYGYNNLIASDRYKRRRPAGDTIVLMDYRQSEIDKDDTPAETIAPRHGGKANVLFGDGHVTALPVEELTETGQDGSLRIKERLLSLEAGTQGIPKEEQQ